jgi:nucleoside-diphosphate-sugar epimerase
MTLDTSQTDVAGVRRCAVTGASGYVGGVIAASLRGSSWDVVNLCRTPPQGAADQAGMTRRFVLGEEVAPDLFAGIDMLVHCAWDFGPIDRPGIWRTNVEGSLRLFDVARSAGVRRMVFISSMSAFQGCKSLYGQSKLAVEVGTKAIGVTVVRPGLVYGSAARGMVGPLMKLASIPLITPLVGLGNMVLYLAHEDDLGNLIAAILVAAPAGDPRDVASHVVAANPMPKTLKQILSILAHAQGKGTKLFMPVPPIAIRTLLRMLESIGMRPRLRSDSLVSLMNQETHPDFAAARAMGVPFREFNVASINARSDEPPSSAPAGDKTPSAL